MGSLMKSMFVALAVVMLLGVSVQAAFLVPTAITSADDYNNSGYALDHLDFAIDATGAEFEPTNRDSLNYAKKYPSHQATWLHNVSVSNPETEIVFDFGKGKVISDVVIWNYQATSSQISKGFENFTVDFSNDGLTFFGGTGQFTALQPNPTVSTDYDTGNAGQIFNFPDTFARYARILITSTYGTELMTGASVIKFNDSLTPGDPVVAVGPADGAVDVDSSTDLEWFIGDPNGATLVDVYFGNGPNDLLIVAGDLAIATTTVPSENLPTLGNGFTYYWKVILIGGYEPNDPFSFTTGLADPVIAESPESLTVAGGQGLSAVFTATVNNADTYVWYKESDPGTALVTAGDIVVADDVLTINNVEEADENWYYCVASHSAKGVEVTTDSARLLTERMVAHWAFEGDFVDDISGYDGTIIGSGPQVTFDTSNKQAGESSIKFGGGEMVQIDDEREFDFYTEGFTANVWVRTWVTGWHSYISKQDDGRTSGFEMKHNSGTSYGVMRPQISTGSGATPVNNSQWHMVTFTYDPAEGKATLHVDGVLRSTDTTGTPVLNNASLIFGGGTSAGMEKFTGQLDELSLYSYALTAMEIAQMYADIKDEIVCYAPQPYDYNNDCKVGLEDFAMFASHWMEDNIVAPTEN